ncbi:MULTISPECIES: 2-dehydropantoate 2-reductase N-terminal domain-containing protein [unclassified Brevibacterium]|uniref:ketopantoate reductase family protein n=1 Tax=unclassified Brevibacterium TaxID=2614124 RepID=UPI001E406FC7|nr:MULTISPECIES: 2-dehydropantoate 2-reductase N-terminal domain-containing protein [unclassified Brevibacterium]MCD1286105.1 ketopantoate reductase [Brevibacterium sp. CCUG 69071]MDK8433456.1 2-dehydropantoate 2-reductase N-terminal domain-containing protein [Brevibacterium sp. H-BE7]
MKILMFGRGVIGTQYAWALETAGHEIDFYVRPGRAADYGPHVDLEIRDGRRRRGDREVRRRWPITMREELTADHDYDLIILSVNHDQMATAVEFLAPRIGKATVLVFNNIWIEPTQAVAGIPEDQIVWGFPGAGGGFFDSTLRGGMVKTVFLGLLDREKPSERDRAVHELFTTAGFSVSEVADFRSWLWFHFILDAAIMIGILRSGGFREFVGSPSAVKESMLHVREMIPVLEAKGGTPRLGAKAVSLIPAGLLGFGLRRLLGGDGGFGYLMDQAMGSGHGNYEMTSIYPRDVLAEARLLGVPVPRLTALEPVFE